MSVNASGSFLPTTANMPVAKSKAKGPLAKPIGFLERTHGTVQHTFGTAIDHKMHQAGQAQANEEFSALQARTPAGNKVSYRTRYGEFSGRGTGGAPKDAPNNLNQTQFSGANVAPYTGGPQAPVRTGPILPTPVQLHPGGNQPSRFAQPMAVTTVQRPMLALPPGMKLAPGATRAPSHYASPIGPQTAPRTFVAIPARGEANPSAREVNPKKKSKAPEATKLVTPYEKVGSKTPGKSGKAVVPPTKPAPKKIAPRGKK